MIKRRRFEHLASLQDLSLQDLFLGWSKTVRAKADQLRPGSQWDILLRKARQADIASHLHDWANSLELQPPK
jgi:hypothetical protein